MNYRTNRAPDPAGSDITAHLEDVKFDKEPNEHSVTLDPVVTDSLSVGVRRAAVTETEPRDLPPLSENIDSEYLDTLGAESRKRAPVSSQIHASDAGETTLLDTEFCSNPFWGSYNAWGKSSAKPLHDYVSQQRGEETTITGGCLSEALWSGC